ncbi:hypothetical protein [Pseudomonas bharatica]|uniref:hypothetical protein n=1 Tax=Pseudomonas bharatica TaxID=2692112 RepID=UPI003B27DF1C
MGANKMREQFEAKFPVPAGVAWKESIGMYEVVDIWKLDQSITISKYNWLWEGWQASRESVVVELPGYGQPDCEEHAEWHHTRNGTIDACARMIEAQGLKVKP